LCSQLALQYSLYIPLGNILDGVRALQLPSPVLHVPDRSSVASPVPFFPFVAIFSTSFRNH
ncbi:MAG: hypothetical protein WBQ31_15270, partial [Candidatus Acidiferrales bacterium]